MYALLYQYAVPFILILVILRYLLCYGFGYILCGLYVSRLENKDKQVLFIKEVPTKMPQGPQPGNFKTLLLNLINGYIRYSMWQTGQIPSHTIRNVIYRAIFRVKLGLNAVVYTGAEIRGSYKLQIGEGSIIGDQSILDARNGISIGKHVNLSTGVWIWTEQHDLNSPLFSSEGGPVHIGDRAWISCRVVILPGVSIGEGAVVAAGAVVTKDIEPFAIYGGIPAKKIGERNPDLIYTFDGSRLKFL
jgi:acetyltransferase-like isoleucine patch superfamily enzyme